MIYMNAACIVHKEAGYPCRYCHRTVNCYQEESVGVRYLQFDREE
jgi:hypothetical protein